MDIICRKLANGMIYAYHKERFWRWDNAWRTWKESHLMAAKFERARAALKTLTPEAFFSDDAEFSLLDDWEIDTDMAEALQTAKPCKTAPIDPVKESPASYVQHCDYSKSHRCENEAGLKHFIKHGEIQGCAGCCTICKKQDVCEYRCEYAQALKRKASPTSSTQCSGAATAAGNQTVASPTVPAASSPMTETAAVVQNSADLGSADENAPVLSSTTPSFDYSGLDTQTVGVLHMAENQYTQGKKMAETGLRWMVNAVSMAHDALCNTAVQQLDNGTDAGVVPQWDNSKHGNRGDDSFRAWCESLGVSKSSAYRLLNVAEKFGNIEIDGKSILDVQPATLLYEAAKPSAPIELVQKVTTGQITSSAEYRAVLKENQQLRTDRVNALNQAEREKRRADAAVSEISERDKTIKSLIDRSEEADARADSMESKYKASLADVQGLTEKNSHLQQSYEYANEAYKTADAQRQKAEAERDKAETRAKNAEDALKKQPITAIVDEEEVDRRAAEKAWVLAYARNAELAKDNADLKKQLAALRSKFSDSVQADFETANYCISSIRAAWDTSKASYSRLVGEDLESTFTALCGTLNAIMEEASLLCRQPPEYDGGEEDE